MKYKKILYGCLMISVLLASFLIYTGNNAGNESENNKNPSSEPYNVVVIVSDALRADVLGCYDGEAKTPNIDWLAENGVLFENAHSTSPFTSPSTVSMFTGEYPYIYKKDLVPPKNVLLGTLLNFQVPEKDSLLAKQLGKANYEVHKDIENGIAEWTNSLQGFEKLKDHSELLKQDKRQITEITGLKADQYQIMHSFLDYLIKTPVGKPFFVLKWILDPHAPYDPPEKFEKEINVDESKLLRKKTVFTKSSGFDASRVVGWTEYEYQYLKALYIKEVESVDERIGYIIKALKSKDLFSRTIIVFTSDHGEAFNEHGGWGHGQDLFEPLVHIPFIMTGPGIGKGIREKTNISLLDLTATLKELLKLDYKDEYQGISFAQLAFQDRSESLDMDAWKKRPLYFVEIGKKESKYQDALLLDRHKLFALKDNTYELYDLSKDPQELNDISTEEEEIVDLMGEQIKKIRIDNQSRRSKYFEKEEQGTSRERIVDKKTLGKLKSLGYIR